MQNGESNKLFAVAHRRIITTPSDIMMGNTENLSDGEIDFKWTLSHSSDRLTESFKHHRMAVFRYFTMKFIIDNIKNENKFDDKLPSDSSWGFFLR